MTPPPAAGMTPLPAALEPGARLVAWRIDMEKHAATWASGEGAFLFGGRWNSRSVRAVYASLDPATAILEVAVHKGFRTLDAVPHMLTAFTISAPERVRVVRAEDIPNPGWLAPGVPGAGQQAFGDALIGAHDFVVLPSVVSRHSWNLAFAPARAAGGYALAAQQPFALDPRLHPAR